MVQYTTHNYKTQIRQSFRIMRIEVDRPLPERAGGFIVLARSYANLFGEAGQLCCCLDIRSGPFGLCGSREITPGQNAETQNTDCRKDSYGRSLNKEAARLERCWLHQGWRFRMALDCLPRRQPLIGLKHLDGLDGAAFQ